MNTCNDGHSKRWLRRLDSICPCNDADNYTPFQSTRDFIRHISYTKEEPLSWKEMIAQPFLSCGLCQDEASSTTTVDEEPIDWGELCWALSGMEFIRISCTDPDVLDALGNDQIIIMNM